MSSGSRGRELGSSLMRNRFFFAYPQFYVKQLYFSDKNTLLNSTFMCSDLSDFDERTSVIWFSLPRTENISLNRRKKKKKKKMRPKVSPSSPTGSQQIIFLAYRNCRNVENTFWRNFLMNTFKKNITRIT